MNHSDHGLPCAGENHNRLPSGDGASPAGGVGDKTIGLKPADIIHSHNSSLEFVAEFIRQYQR